jgi:hypothetical protein
MKDYEVGYKKPPVEHQIKKGFTKNYAGRPKRKSTGGTNSYPPDAAVSSDPFLREAARMIAVRDGDEVREVSVIEALARTLAARGLKNDLPASRLFLRWLDRAKSTQAAQVDAAFKKGFEDKVAQLVTLRLSEMDRQSTADMPLHPDRIILRADGLVEVLPTLEAAQLRRQRLTRRAELEDKAQRLQILINQRQRKSDVASLKSILAELRQLRQLDIVDDMPGIEDAARRMADERVTAIRGVVGGFQTLTETELREELKKRGLPPILLEE